MTSSSVSTNNNVEPEYLTSRQEQAAYWHTLLQAGDLPEQKLVEFQQWFAEPENAIIYQRFEVMWQQVDSLDTGMAKATVTSVLKQQGAEQSIFKSGLKRTGAGLGMLVLCSFLALHAVDKEVLLSDMLLSGRVFADYSSDVGEVRTIKLPDDSVLTLNTFTSVDVEYTKHQRIIRLHQGEIQLDVATDSNRPLLVINDQASARALGTRFSVRDFGDQTEVKVTESSVEVCAYKVNNCQVLRAGESTQVVGSNVLAPELINPDYVIDWEKQLLIVNDQPLVKVLDELSRHYPGVMKINREGLKDHRVSGVYALNDLPASLQVLESTAALQISQLTPFVQFINKK